MQTQYPHKPLSAHPHIIVIGGGLAGLTASIQLAQAGLGVTLVERKHYPFHKVCGEYVSREALPFLRRLGLDVETLGAADVRRFWLSAPDGKSLKMPLDMGGVGISRYALDNALYELAKASGVKFVLGKKVSDTWRERDTFFAKVEGGETLSAPVILSAHGKRSNLDKGRDFFRERSPWFAVKYHYRADFPRDTVALHNFRGGYGGINAIEDGRICVCYLAERRLLKEHGGIEAFEEKVMHRNPHLAQIFRQGESLYAKPEVINEISFLRKPPVEDGLLMLGDAAGMIAPLCGNGMAMAIHGAQLAAREVIVYFHDHRDRARMEKEYAAAWQAQFARRLWVGRQVQRAFGHPALSSLAVGTARAVPVLAGMLMKGTHGKEF